MIRITVYGRRRVQNQSILRNAKALGIHDLLDCHTANLYFLSHNPGAESIDRLCAFLLADPVTQEATWEEIADDISHADSGSVAQAGIARGVSVIEVALRPGVTDIEARELARGMVELGMPYCEVATASRHELTGALDEQALHLLARKLFCNETIEQYSLLQIRPHFGVATEASDFVEQIALTGLDGEALEKLSRERLLSLDLAEMQTIRDFFDEMERAPTDVELETLAQTWSEHCVHKTFRARITFAKRRANGLVYSTQEIDGLLNQYIRAATEAIDPPWLYSAFVDDAGIIAFDETHDLAFKAETHNHPSALEPFGGANTGVGGVVRDIMAVSARPIACTDVLCFGPQEFAYEELPEGILHPRRIADGVVAGVGDYGNKLGLPTVNGAVIYDQGYLGNPLVFCGCVGLLPHGSHPTEPQVNDLVVVLGGRTGRDGLHGATFSSAELTHDSAETTGSAVQIGDPITEKGLIELIEAARDEQLYAAITDCGAGGLSSSIGEMGETLGVDVELTHIKLKYPGLTPWEIWLSEAQERLVVAVPLENIERLRELANLWDVEVSILGRFTGDGNLTVRYQGKPVADISMQFLHDGLPQRKMRAEWQEPELPTDPHPQIEDYNALLLSLLAHPNVASKEDIIRQYDHEVRGGTIVRPLTGPQMDGPTDAALLKPLGTWQHHKAFTLSNGINPLLGERDPYAMAVSAVDEAIRNAVAVGADPDQIALLDNFCWGNPTYKDRLGTLVLACQGCYDAAMTYRTPFISGKDSLYNEFNGEPIPGTLLISAIGIVPDMHKHTTSDFKEANNFVYLIGETKAELGGSLLYSHQGYLGGQAPMLPEEPLIRYRLLHQAIGEGFVQACHDLSEGGLAISLAEMALAGRLGAQISLQESDLSATEQLFSESNGRLLIEVRPSDVPRVEALFYDQSCIQLGKITEDLLLSVVSTGEPIIELSIPEIVNSWKGQSRA